jgi:hypothetical protein
VALATNRSRWIIASALGAGILAGVWLTRPHRFQPAFLAGATTIAVRDASVVTSGGIIRGTTTYFSFEGNWEDVFRRARAEMPHAIVRDATISGSKAKILTQPRIEGGRTHLFFPPEREITIFPQRLVLNEGGQLIQGDPHDKRWASVKVSEYREPHMLDSAVDWLKDQLNI